MAVAFILFNISGNPVTCDIFVKGIRNRVESATIAQITEENSSFLFKGDI